MDKFTCNQRDGANVFTLEGRLHFVLPVPHQTKEFRFSDIGKIVYVECALYEDPDFLSLIKCEVIDIKRKNNKQYIHAREI